MSFWNELRRRNVVKVGAAYLVVAWIIAQVVSLISEPLSLPGWFLTAVIVLLLIGFPLALLFAWAFELTPEGIKATRQVPVPESITQRTGHRLNYVVTALLAAGLGIMAVDTYLLDDARVSPAAAIDGLEADPYSIAVIPFANLSSDEEQEFFVDGLSEALIHQLGQVDALSVTARTSSFMFKDEADDIRRVGQLLGVSYAVVGSVRKADNEIAINAQLVSTTDGFELWSESYGRELDDILAIQDDIAGAVVQSLQVALGIDSDEVRLVGGTDNPEAYELYLTSGGRDFLNMTSVQRSLNEIDQALLLDPAFALAWARRSTLHRSLALLFEPSSALNREISEQDAQRAVELAPNAALARQALASASGARGNWSQAEAEYRQALDQGEAAGYGLFQFAVGNIRAAEAYLLEDRNRDPLNVQPSAFVGALYDSLGNIDEARAEYERAYAILSGGTVTAVVINSAITELGGDDSDLGRVLVEAEEIMPGIRSVRENLDDPAAAITAIEDMYSSDILNAAQIAPLLKIFLAALAARLGDSEFALDGMEEAIDWFGTQAYFLWRPVFSEARRTERFRQLVREIGMVDYWREYGWPDLCRPDASDDFACE